nr:hypothetical protein [Tanacetum cinerariifolium]
MAFEQRSSKPELQSMTSEQPSATARTVPPAQEPQVRQTSTTSTSIADTTPTPTNSSSHAINILITSQDVEELNPNAMFDGNTFVNPFANPSTSATESTSSQNVDSLNMHTFYQPYPHEFQWTKDHPLKQNVKEAMTDPAWIDSMQEELLQFKRLDHDEEQTIIQNRSHLVVRGYRQEEGIDFEESYAPAKPTEKHLKEVKRIFRYLIGPVNTCLWYRKDFGFELTGFSDADYARCKNTFKSTFGGAQFLGEKLLTDYGFHFNKIPIYCDLKSAIAISYNPVQHQEQNTLMIRRWHYNLIPAESKFKTPCSIIKDKYMMKAQVHVSKPFIISDVQALP